MPVPLEQFVKQLEDSGILVGDTLKDFIPPKASPRDAEELARELVRQKKLTKFQAEEVSRGKGKTLVLGNYVLMEKIGAGGMGQVFKAEHRRMKRVVAIKMLPPNVTKDKTAIARFQREVEAAAKLRHPNIVAADDADCANGIHFLVMELVEGSDLSALVKKNGPIPVDQAVNYILQAAKGLEAAHAEGIVHRDIKPANLLLEKKGTVKILDMGLARLNVDRDAPTQSDLTSTGTVMGTVDYMAPEQALDTKTADARADIYALGCSLHYLLTGKATYEGDTVMKKLLAHREQPIPSLPASRPDISDRLDAIFQKMVAKKVEDRFQTVTDLIANLEQFRSQQQPSSSTQKSLGSFSDTGLTDFLKELPTVEIMPTQLKVVKVAAATVPPKGKNKKLMMIGAGILGVLILLAALVVKLTTKEGTLIVTVNEPDAEVQVDEGKVEITKGDKKPITITIDPGKHRLKVTKDGFELFTQEFSLEAKGKEQITAKLVPLEEKSVVAASSWHGWPADCPKPAIAPFDAEQARKHQEEWAAYLKIPVEYTNSIGMKFRLMPPGEFMMGGTAAEIEEAIKYELTFAENFKSEAPQHKVILTQPFYLGVNEVTQALYEKVMGQNPAHFSATGVKKDAVVGMDTSDHPVEGVGFVDAAEFCAKLSQREKLKPFYFRADDTISPLDGTGYRLPTEAEWEFACRAGVTTKYWIGSQDQDLLRIGWFNENSGLRTHTAGELRANPFGLFDVHGNNFEWVQDLWEPTYYGGFKEKPAIDPNGPSVASFERVVRGGSWLHSPTFCRASVRFGFPPQLRNPDIGFRASLTVEAVKQAELTKTGILNDPAFQQWVKDVAALPAEQQVEAVSKKLVDLNPGFDGKVTPKIERGVVTGLQFLTDNVTDISPVRGLAMLAFLECKSSPSVTSNLSDLSPLKGLQLQTLAIQGTKVFDLSPIQGMKLTQFYGGETKVADLSPLRDMPLTMLSVSSTQVTDLSPMKGLKLREVLCVNTRVNDLSPLQGMPLTTLKILNTQVADLSPLTGMPLKLLQCDFKPFRDTELLRSIRTLETINGKTTVEFWKQVEAQHAAFDQWVKDVAALPAEQQVEAVSKKLVDLNPGFDGKVTPTSSDKGVVTGFRFLTDNVSDISPVRALNDLTNLECYSSDWGKGILVDLAPLKGMKLTHLNCARSPALADLSPLEGMPLSLLNCGGSQVADLSPLKGMLLAYLDFTATQVPDLSVLEGMPLSYLSCMNTKVSDLSPLKGMDELQSLDVMQTGVTDISLLKGLPLRRLSCVSTKVTDFTVLKDLPLKALYLDFKPFRDTELLRSIQTLETINGKTTVEFWKQVEAQQAAFDQWAKDVQAMPAEQQVEAVSKKLVDLNPGFDGKVTPTMQEGVVTVLAVVTDNVTDISPIGALTGLKHLSLYPTQLSGSKLADLSPLQGMPLTSLIVGGCQIADLSPLKGMPLRVLSCSYSHVTDLSPLAGMPLTNLDITQTEITELSSLKDMPLESLHIESSLVSNLSPLKKMPLKNLGCSHTLVADLTPLKDLPLQHLTLDFLPKWDSELIRSIKTLETINEKPAAEFCEKLEIYKAEAKKPLAFEASGFDQWVKQTAALSAEEQVITIALKLQELNPGFDGKVTPTIEGGVVTGLQFFTDNVLDISPVRALGSLSILDIPGSSDGRGKLLNLSPLKGLPLTKLYIHFTQVSDLSPLQGMKLTQLNSSKTLVADLSPLKDMPLTVLYLTGQPVHDLSPLKGMPLNLLACNFTYVADLSPLKGLSLTTLYCAAIKVTDFSLLKGMPLKNLDINFKPERDSALLRSIKTLETINEKPTAEFWKDVEKK